MTVSELLREVEEMMADTVSPILSGQCVNFEDYRSRVARLRAFQEVIELTKPKKRETSESTQGRSDE